MSVCVRMALSQQLINAQKELQRRRQLAGIAPREAEQPVSTSADWPPRLQAAYTAKPTAQPTTQTKSQETVKAYPSMLTAILKHELAAAGRIYLLARHLDQQGRGCLLVEDVRQALTKKGSALRVCGWRRLRQIFHQGEGIFWQRDRNGRLWLAGAPKIGQNLACERFQGKPIAFPVQALLGGIQAARAHFYASFHSSRKEAAPISRETLRGVTGVPERTQLEYDQVAQVKREANIVIGGVYEKASAEKRAWRQGRGVFSFIDVQGQQGAKNRTYLAWRLPNNYHGPHQQCCKGRQKKINQDLVALVMKGMQGNGSERIDKVFWPHGAAAGRAFGRTPQVDAYWPDGQTRGKRFILWSVLPSFGR